MREKKYSRKSRRPSAKKDDDGHVRVNSKFCQTYALNSNTAVNAIGNISTAVTTGILAGDVNIQSLTDMFRLYKINSITFEFLPSTSVAGAAVQMPSGILGFVPFGNATNPAAIGDFETFLQSKPTVSFPTTTTVAGAALTRECGTQLTLQNKDMPILQGPGGGWLATQDDGTQTSFGKIFWALAGTTASSVINYLLKTTFDISFKDLLDPALISKTMSSQPTGIPSHWQLAPGTPLYHLRKCADAVRNAIPQSMPPPSEENRDALRRADAQFVLAPRNGASPGGGNRGVWPFN